MSDIELTYIRDSDQVPHVFNISRETYRDIIKEYGSITLYIGKYIHEPFVYTVVNNSNCKGVTCSQ